MYAKFAIKDCFWYAVTEALSYESKIRYFSEIFIVIVLPLSSRIYEGLNQTSEECKINNNLNFTTSDSSYSFYLFDPFFFFFFFTENN